MFLSKIKCLYPQTQRLFQKQIFNMRSYHQTIVENEKYKQQQEYSREDFELRKLYGKDYELIKQQKQQERLQHLKDVQLRDLPQNDKNPQNHIKVKINQNVITNPTLQQQIITQNQLVIPKDNEDPVFLKVLPREPLKLVCSYTKNVPSSIKRLWAPARLCRGKYAYDALSLLRTVYSKPSRLIQEAIQKTINKARNMEMDTNRLYVHSVQIGRYKKVQGLWYRGKGRAGIKHRQTSVIRVFLKEKPLKELYSEMLKGKTAPVLAYFLREKLIRENVGYQSVQQYQQILTSKGRQQQKLMLKRTVQALYMRFKLKGKTVNKKLIEERILESESIKWVEKFEDNSSKDRDNLIKKRMEVFKKNQELTG